MKFWRIKQYLCDEFGEKLISYSDFANFNIAKIEYDKICKDASDAMEIVLTEIVLSNYR